MKHILLYGERRSGKSTLITEIAESIEAEIYGYMTRRLEDTRDGFHPIYIHPAAEYMNSVRAMEAEAPGSARGVRIRGLRYDDGNLIAWCDGKKHEPNLQAFNEPGVNYIQEAFSTAIIDDADYVNSIQNTCCVNCSHDLRDTVSDSHSHGPLNTGNDNGLNIASNTSPDKIIIMDEVGFLEGQAGLFRQTVLDAFKSDIPVICGVKKYPECDFTNEILKLDNVHVLNLTPDTRSSIRRQVINIIKNEWGLKLNLS